MQDGTGGLRAAILRQNVLFDLSDKLVIVWSAKAACTTVLKWYLHRNGLLHEALTYSRWVHHYRREILPGRADVQAARAAYRPALWRHVKVVRNPYTRVVSSYLHAVRTNYCRGQVQRALGLGSGAPYSFTDFIGYLETENIDVCNIHHRRQSHRCERSLPERAPLWAPQHLVRIENGLERQLRAIDSRLGRSWDNALTQGLSRSPHHRDYDHLSQAFCGDYCFKFEELSPSPPPAAFYDQGLRARIELLYAPDFECYDYSKEEKSIANSAKI